MFRIDAKPRAQPWHCTHLTLILLPPYSQVNLFRIDAREPIWHSIYSHTDRWSCGVHITDQAAARIIAEGQAAARQG